MVELADVKTGTTHVVELPVAGLELRLLYFDPRSGTNVPLPPGPKVEVRDFDPTTSRGDATVSVEGRVSVRSIGGLRNVHLRIDFKGREFIDLETQTYVAKEDVQAVDTRPLIAMPNAWDSRDQSSFSDDRDGRFADGILDQLIVDKQGIETAPWELQIDFSWHKIFLGFEFFNCEWMAHEAVPPGLRVDAFSGVAMLPVQRIGSGTVLSDDGLIYLGLFKKVDPRRIRLRIKTTELSVLDLKETDPTKRMKTTSAKVYDGLPPDRRHQLYALPQLWLSKNQKCVLDKPGVPTLGVFEDFVTTHTSAAKRLVFHLDDFVLVRRRGGPRMRFKEVLPVTMFDHVMAVREPDPNEPYLTTGTFEANHFSGREYFAAQGRGADGLLRVVRRGASFFDLKRDRTTSGPLVGVRAAVKNDHPVESKRNYIRKGSGNYDVHFFGDCLLQSNGRLLSHVLVHWSCKFVKDPAAPPPTPLHPPPAAGSIIYADLDAAITDFKKNTMLAVQHRWQGEHPAFSVAGAIPNAQASGEPASPKDYILRPAGPSSTKRDIKVYFYLRSSDTEDVDCTVTVFQGCRANMGLTEGQTQINDGAPLPPRYSLMDNADGKTYGWHTFAHEVGHALGLPDEYYEAHDVEPTGEGPLAGGTTPGPRLPKFWQGLRPDHLTGDILSLMNNNRAPRLRHYWPFARWVNENRGVQAEVNDERYVAEYTRPVGAVTRVGSAVAPGVFRYDLPSPELDYFTPIAEDKKFGAGGRTRLALFRLGQDETAFGNLETLTEGVDGVLVVAMNLFFKFVDRPGGAWPTGAAGVDAMLKLFYRLENAARALSGDAQEPAHGPLLPPGVLPRVLTTFETVDQGAPKRVTLDLRFRYSVDPRDRRKADRVLLVRRSSGTDADDLGGILEPSRKRRVHLCEGTFSDGKTPCTPGIALLRFLLGLETTTGAGGTALPKFIQAFTATDFNRLANFVADKVGGTVQTVRRA